MKTSITLILTLVILTGCKKDRTCNCYGETDVLVSTHKVNGNRNEAKKKCNPYGVGYDGRFEGYCKLK